MIKTVGWQVTWALLVTSVAQELAERATAAQLSSLRTLVIAGAAASDRMLDKLQVSETVLARPQKP